MSKRLSALVVASAAVMGTAYVLSNRGGEGTPMELAVVDASVDYGLEIDVAGQANGTIVIDLFEDLAPLHVAQITSIAQDGGYDGVVFHRVIDGFMAQTGDVQFGKGADTSRAGMGGSELPDIQAEFSETPFARGIVGMARSQSPNSANSQFFIMFQQGDFLNGQYTVVGEVTSGMDVVDQIKLGTGPNGSVLGEADKMAAVRVTQ
jgi:peptidylprolyl isomerase